MSETTQMQSGSIGRVPSIDIAARELAGAHSDDDDNLTEIYLLPHPTEIRLLEVTSSVGPTGEVLPFRFEPAADVPYRSLVVQLHPDDWARRSELEWPVELDLAAVRQIIKK